MNNLAALAGQSLTGDLNQMASQTVALRDNINSEVGGLASSINSLTSQIGALNLQIENVTAGGTSASDAAGLNDQRLQALKNLSQLIGTKAVTQANGSVSVYVNGDFLVDDGTVKTVIQSDRADQGQTVTDLRIEGTNTLINPPSGQLQGLLAARDSVIPNFLNNLNQFTGTLISGFNKIYSSGQGLNGYSTTTAENAVDNPNTALNATGLTFPPSNGSFQLQVTDKTTGLTKTTNINVNLSGAGQQTSLTDLATQLNAVNGIQATIGSDNRLTITSTSASQQFSFANDTSGVLTALGINTFFTGSTAGDIGVNATVLNDPSKFAASQGGIAADTNNATALVQFGTTLTQPYENLVNDVTQGSAQATATATAADSYATTLTNQHTATSGVSIDEETIKMLGYQQAYEASAKYISTLSDLFKTLTQL